MMVKELSFVEEYRGKQIPEGKKSIMLSYRIGNDDSTRAQITKTFQKELQAGHATGLFFFILSLRVIRAYLSVSLSIASFIS